ncbi:TonB-dependent siderophore receptor [Chitinolyticbacter meiyuanensis]|uniref:TonB-dependent siderophore receptor n=1 Tax=Chitinolyticbacter meiyuanensis TaxID=682798 RepID=UPI0011E5FAC5|nr:TonB-dependent siderophore receptor [Chitinolyticbacter meiyuanensis]
MNTTPHRLRPIIASLALACAAPHALAEDATVTLDTVTVSASALEDAQGPVYGYVAKRSRTGSKTDSSLLEIPQSVTVITKEQLQDQAIHGVDQALRYSSGVVGGAYGSDARSDWLLVRGFTPAIFLDGMTLPNGGWTTQSRVEPYGLERIEVLKGPSSVLYGQLPPGGMVNLVSKRPTEDALREVGVEIGSYNHKQATVDLGGPLNTDGTWLYRLTALASDGDTHIDHNEDKRLFVAPALTWKPDANTSLTLLARYQKAETGNPGGFLPAQGTLLPNPNGKISPSFDAGEPDFDTYEKEMSSIGYEFAHEFNDTWTVRQNLRYARTKVVHDVVGPLGLQSDLRTLNRYTYTPHDDTKMFSVDNQVEARLITGQIAHTVLAGLDYREANDEATSGFGSAPPIDVFDPVYGAPIVRPADGTHVVQKQQQLGIYLQDQIKYDRWVLTLSGRQDWVDTDADNKISGTTTTQDDRAFSSRVGLNYVFDSGLAPYVAYSKSFQPTLERSFSGDAFSPTRGVQYEGGVKYQPTGTNHLLSMALFQTTQENALTVDPDHMFFSVQQGEVEVKGLEFESKFNFQPGFNVMASYTYSDSEITKGNDATTLGKQIPLLPKHQAALWADYTLQGTALKGLGFGAGVRYTGSSYGDAANLWKADSYTLLDLSVHYEIQDWRLQLNINNVTDKEYFSACNSINWCYYGYPRVTTLSARYRW